MPQRNDRSRSTPTTSPKNNSWFRMQAGHQSDADIYIYDEIGFWGVTAKQFISDLNALGDITHINLHINSPGGDVFEGIAIFNALKTHGASITVYVDGVAASMASVIAMVGNPVIMPENTFMMIHKPFGFTGGDAEDMRTYADLLDKVEAVLLPAYAQKTGKTTDEIAAMLADETWMSGAECLAYGFADQVTPAVTDIRQVETAARYLGTGLYWIAASINIKPGHDYYFYIRSVNTVGKSAFVEAVGRASDDAEGYLDFFKGQITESHLGKELLEKVDLTEDNASRLDEFSKEWKDANDKWNAMWGVKIEQTKDGKHYVAGIGLSMEDTEEGKLSQFLVAANRIAFIDPANGNETPMFVAQGNQIFMNDVFLKRLTAPTITSGGSPPVFSLTSDGKLTAKNADTDLAVRSLTTSNPVKSGGGRIDVLGSTSDYSKMDCFVRGFDSTGNSLAWALGSSVGVSKMLSLKNFFSGAEILLNGNDGAVQLKTGAVNGAKAQALTINKDEVNSTVDLTLTKQSGTGNRFVLQNSGNAELPFSVRVWGSSTRQNVFEVGTSAAYLFYAQKTSAGQLFDVNGAINCTTLNQSSDRDLKDDILVISDATKAIRKMNGYTYTLKENGMPYAGVIAQEVMEAIPEAVGSFTHYGEELQGPTVDGNELREETRYLNVDYSAVTGLLVQVARETDDRVTALEEENTTLRENLATAGTRITTLENQVSELVALVGQLTGSEH